MFLTIVEIIGLLKNIGKIPIKVNYDKSFIRIHKIPEEYKDPIDSAFLEYFKVDFPKFSGNVFLDTGITYPIPSIICDLPKKGNLYFNIIFNIDSHKDTYSRKDALFPKGKKEFPMVYNITLFLPEDVLEVSHGSLE